MKVKKFNELNEGARDLMIGKSDAEVVKIINKFISDSGENSAIKIIERLSNFKLLQYLNEDMRNKLVNEILNDKSIAENEYTQKFDNFFVCENDTGDSMIFINLNNNKIFMIGLYAYKDVLSALKNLL